MPCRVQPSPSAHTCFRKEASGREGGMVGRFYHPIPYSRLTRLVLVEGVRWEWTEVKRNAQRLGSHAGAGLSQAGFGVL